jgi:hypothetical protein
MAEEVDVQIYIQGKGPVHKLKVPLEGWDKNKIEQVSTAAAVCIFTYLRTRIGAFFQP